MRPRLLDLFCGAGGAARGYHDAGFNVRGVDITIQQHYPYSYSTAGWNRVSLHGYDAFHASPPCQAYSAMTHCRPGLMESYEKLISAVRERLQATGKPYIIENVQGAPLAEQPDLWGNHGVTLCGRMFGLDLYRHRIFESNIPLVQPDHPDHVVPASPAGHWEPGTVMSVAGHVSPIEEARRAMGIGWMNREELAEAIPPAYTSYIGQQLIRALEFAA